MFANESLAAFATAKDPLLSASFFTSPGFPGHMPITFFEHSPTTDLIFDTAARASTFAEVQT